jgi:hypothetical protein
MKELFEYLFKIKKFWLMPVILLLLLLGALIVYAGASAASPFIYTLF